jgi:hypothetical protein
MKTFIALAGVVVGGVTITAATILTVWNFTAGLLMLAAAFTVLVFTAWLIRRHEDRDELSLLQQERDYCRAGMCVPAADLQRQLDTASVKIEDLRAKEKRWLGHYDVCERAQAVADHDRDQAASNA